MVSEPVAVQAFALTGVQVLLEADSQLLESIPPQVFPLPDETQTFWLTPVLSQELDVSELQTFAEKQ